MKLTVKTFSVPYTLTKGSDGLIHLDMDDSSKKHKDTETLNDTQQDIPRVAKELSDENSKAIAILKQSFATEKETRTGTVDLKYLA